MGSLVPPAGCPPAQEDTAVWHLLDVAEGVHVVEHGNKPGGAVPVVQTGRHPRGLHQHLRQLLAQLHLHWQGPGLLPQGLGRPQRLPVLPRQAGVGHLWDRAVRELGIGTSDQTPHRPCLLPRWGPVSPRVQRKRLRLGGKLGCPREGARPPTTGPGQEERGCAPHLGVRGQQVQVLPVVRLQRLHLTTEPPPLHHMPAESACAQLPGQGGEGLALGGQRLQDLEEEAVSARPPRPGTRPRRGRRTCSSICTTSRSSSRHRKGYSENRPLCTSTSRWFLVSCSTRHSAFSQWSRRVCRVFRCEG